MNYCATDRDIVLIVQPVDAIVWHAIDLDNPPVAGPDVRMRQLILRPGVFRGQRVLRAYDQETDTLYIKAQP